MSIESEQSLSDQETASNVADESTSTPDAGQPEQQADSGSTLDADELARAKKLGHQDKEAFLARGGKEDAWVPPDEFLKVHDRQLPLIRREAKKLERMLQAKDQEMADMRREMADMRKYQQEQQQARGQIESDTLWGMRKQAMEASDFDEVNRIDRRLHEMRSVQAPPQPQVNGSAQIDPTTKAILDDFADDYPMYRDNPKMQAVLTKAIVMSATADPSLKGRSLLEEAHDTARRIWSDLYTQPAARKPAMAEMGGAPARPKAGQRSWGDLKPDVQQALDSWIKSEPAYMKMGLEKARARMVSNASDDQFRSR